MPVFKGTQTHPELFQIHIGPDFGTNNLVKYCETQSSVYLRNQETLEKTLLTLCPRELWPIDSNSCMSPRPILVVKEHQEQLSELNAALTAAVSDIVDRWWTEKEARFPERMPLEKKEEELLRVLAENSCAEPGAPMEIFQITEINARFPFNGLLHQAYGQDALGMIEDRHNCLTAGTNTGKVNFGLQSCNTDISFSHLYQVLNGLLSLFRHNLPLHFLKGEEPGLDIHMVVDFVQRQIGLSPRLTSPQDLRLLPDPHKEGKHTLCCLVDHDQAVTSSLFTPEGEAVEEVYQLGLELHQHELDAMQPEILQQVSLRCFNDLRTILLVHDKRMLGIVKEELDHLVARNVLSPTQAQALDRRIADTFLPGSGYLDKVLYLSKVSPEIRNQFFLKPVRGGKGAGIVFGDEYEPDQWVSILKRLQSPTLGKGGTYVVQRRITPRLYDVVLKASGERTRYPLVGTYHAIHGQLIGFGVWRCSPHRICTISMGGSWTCTVMQESIE
ncbi:hypothetical protein N7520_005227 [Penicillium odoratum]|uniref:uncharacterized protein n=1 Tax=Penicillium odoratum TaxID=1167516 RepID=UPI002548D71E|nr:uncharacterized protein N7520_005227 [Penicillium odoratum]KAJ5765668.1 hypothetical protein N7520_005227 [Penicillium odoratum]